MPSILCTFVCHLHRSTTRTKTRKTTRAPRARQKALPPKQLPKSPSHSSTAQRPPTSGSGDHESTSTPPPTSPTPSSEDPLPTNATNPPPQRSPSPHSTSSRLLPPPRSRRSLSERLRLAARDAQTPTTSRGLVTSEARTPTQQSVVPTSRGEMIRNLYKLSAKELAQPTEYEARTQRKGSRQARDKTPPTQKTPQLHQFKSFVVESPTKSPR